MFWQWLRLWNTHVKLPSMATPPICRWWALLDGDVIIDHSALGAPLSADHARPVRFVYLKRSTWMSAKWLKAIKLTAKDRPGF